MALRSTQSLNEMITYLVTPWCRVLLDRLTGLQLVKKFPAFYGTRRFITTLTSLRHPSLSWASPVQSIYSHPTSWSCIIILSTHLHLGLPSGLLPSGFPTNTLYTPLSSPIRATCPTHLILLDFITRTILGEEYRSFSSSLCKWLPGVFPDRREGYKGGRCVGLTTLPPSIAYYLETWEHQPPEALWACTRIAVLHCSFLDVVITLGSVHCLKYMDLEKPEGKCKIFNSHFTSFFKYVYLRCKAFSQFHWWS